MKAIHVVKDPKKGVGHHDNKVFGAALDPSSTCIPPILEACVIYLDATGLELEGVFRKSGSLQQLKEYRAKIDNGEKVDFSDVSDPHIVAGLLKLYIREYPEPLLTFELYDCFLAAVAIPDVTVKVPKVKQVLSMLPSANLMIVKYLVAFLCRVSANSQMNFMTPANLAIVFAPNLLRPPYEGDEGIGIMMEDTPFANQLLQLFINHYDALFTEYKPSDAPKAPQDSNSAPAAANVRIISGKPTPPKKPNSLPRQPSAVIATPLPVLPTPPTLSAPPTLPTPPSPTATTSSPPSISTSTSASAPPPPSTPAPSSSNSLSPRPASPPPKPASVLNRAPSHPLPLPPSPAPAHAAVAVAVSEPKTPNLPPKPAPVHPNNPTYKQPNEPPVVSPRHPLPPTPSTSNEQDNLTPTPPPKPALANNPYRRSVKPLPTAPAPSTISTNSLDLAKRLPAPPMYAK